MKLVGGALLITAMLFMHDERKNGTALGSLCGAGRCVVSYLRYYEAMYDIVDICRVNLMLGSWILKGLVLCIRDGL
jgi:hypothetical protein